MQTKAASIATENQPCTLVCISNEQESAAAMRFACLRAKRRNHHVIMLHVVEPTEFQGLSSITETIREEREEEAQKLLHSMEECCAKEGILHPGTIIREDSLSNGITSAIEDNPNINMIILAVRTGSHRGPKLVAALTEELGDTITVPIMIVPGNLTKEQINSLS